DLGIDLLRFVRADLRVRIAHDVDHFLGDVAQTKGAADHGGGIDFVSLFQGPLGLRILDLVLVLDDLLDDPDDDVSGGAIELRFERLASLVVLASRSKRSSIAPPETSSSGSSRRSSRTRTRSRIRRPSGPWNRLTKSIPPPWSAAPFV